MHCMSCCGTGRGHHAAAAFEVAAACQRLATCAAYTCNCTIVDLCLHQIVFHFSFSICSQTVQLGPVRRCHHSLAAAEQNKAEGNFGGGTERMISCVNDTMAAAQWCRLFYFMRFHLYCSQPPKEEKVFTKRGSILGSLTASISEALSSSASSSTVSHSDTLSSSADANGGIFMTLKRKGSLLSGAIFQSSEGAGDHMLSLRLPSSRADVQLRTQAFRCSRRRSSVRQLKHSVRQQVRAGARDIGRYRIEGNRARSFCGNTVFCNEYDAL